VSLQVAILKVLASYPDGRTTLAEMKADLAILAGAGRDWSDRLKRLAARVPNLDIFSQGSVRRDNAGWQLTSAGRELLTSIETPVTPIQVPIAGDSVRPKLEVVSSSTALEQSIRQRPQPAIRIRTDRPRRRRQKRAVELRGS
jgi:hypothetical protein